MNYEWLDDAPNSVRFGASDGGIILLFDEVSIKPHPELEDFLGGVAKVQAPGIIAVGKFDFFYRDVLILAEGLETLDKDLSGVAGLSSDDDCFDLKITMDRGTVEFVGHLRPHYDSGATVSFAYRSDQTFVHHALESLRKLLAQSS